jgi:hypothetical protein
MQHSVSQVISWSSFKKSESPPFANLPKRPRYVFARQFETSWIDCFNTKITPADEFFDPIDTVVGDAPTQDSVVAVFKLPEGPRRLAAELNSWLGVDSVTATVAKQLLEVTITNNFGPDALGKPFLAAPAQRAPNMVFTLLQLPDCISN